MEKKIYTIIRSICFVCLFCLPLIYLIFSLFRLGTLDLNEAISICNTFSIPFVHTALHSLSNLFEVSSSSIVVKFFEFYISSFIYYLCIEILLILLESIHYLFHYFERKVLR